MNNSYANQLGAMQQRASSFGSAIGAANSPKEPTLLGRGEELLKHVAELEREHARLRGNLLGLQESEVSSIPTPVTTIDGMLARACQQVACLVGDMATINGCVG